MKNLNRLLTAILLCFLATTVIKAEYVTFKVGESRTLKLGCPI